jgi:hypothetical protein
MGKVAADPIRVLTRDAARSYTRYDTRYLRLPSPRSNFREFNRYVQR